MKIKIEIPDGYEIDVENSTFENIILKEIKLPKRFGDLDIVSGYWISNKSMVYPISSKPRCENKNIFPSEEEAHASIAISQLCQLRNKYNGNWKPDFSKKELHCIVYFSDNNILIEFNNHIHSVLYFKNQHLAEEFIINFKDLIETAKPLL